MWFMRHYLAVQEVPISSREIHALVLDFSLQKLRQFLFKHQVSEDAQQLQATQTSGQVWYLRLCIVEVVKSEIDSVLLRQSMW